MNTVICSRKDFGLICAATAYVEGYQNGYIQNVVTGSSTTKARLLHYFPPPEDGETAEQSDSLDSWCGIHISAILTNGR